MQETGTVNAAPSPSARQSSAAARWDGAEPASAEAISQILGANPDLAQQLERLDCFRMNPRRRHGQDSLIAAFYQRGIGGEYHVSATQFVTGDGGDLDFSGARETKMYRNQDAATYQLKAAKGQSKSSGRLILAMGILDAVAMHIATGYQTLALATARIPHHFCQEIADNHKLKQILIVGATEAEASEIKLRLLDAGYQGKILWTGDPTVGSKEVMRFLAVSSG